jgi:type VI secretion system protein ImpK
MSQQPPYPPMGEDPALLQVRRPPRRDEPPATNGAAPGVARLAAAPLAAEAEPRPAEPQNARAPEIDEVLLRLQGAANPLLAAATPLLTLVCQLRGTLRNDDEARLQWMVAEELKAFESRALQAEASPQDVVAARYVLCSLIDETVLSTPWGSLGAWASQSMLSIFHKETWGGEKVFVILDRIKAKPARYLHLLELIQTCLALGFRGRFEVLDNGMFRLEELRGEIRRILAGQRSEKDAVLSPPYGVERVRRSLMRYVPLWVVFAVAGALLIAIYGGFQYALVQTVDETAAALDHIVPQP